MSEVDKHFEELLGRIVNAKDLAEVDALELEAFGRKQGVMTIALKELGAMSAEERKSKGQALNVWKNRLEDAVAMRRQELNQSAMGSLGETDALDATLELPKQERGHLHPIPEFIRTVEDVFGRMGFDVADGPEIESEEYNFTLLNIPQDHPARDAADTFWLAGEQDQVLRTHTSPVQIHYMRSHTPPFRMICPGRVYRRDADATHSPMFHQFEGLMIGPDVSLAHMKAVMVEAMRALIGRSLEFRFRTSYFPFVEPGLEVDMRWTASDSSTGKWLEVVGCGMVHPHVLKHAGIDPQKFQGFAFGFGIERLLMIKHGISDLRTLYENDARFLRQF